jgi:predicted O-methyltransferase YrrM
MSKIRISEKLIILKNYINYSIRAKHRMGLGIHSPFVYDFVANVLFDKKYYPEYDYFRNLRKELMNSADIIYINEIGAGSKKFKGTTRHVSDMIKFSSVNEKFGRLLFRLTRYYKPLSILEFGTSVGLSTIYIAKGGNVSTIYTVEGNNALCNFAKSLFNKKELYNIEIIEGLFEEKLKTVVPLLIGFPLIFIDGDHSYLPTLNYYKYLSEKLDEYILIFDDISWSKEMLNAWEEIVFHSRSEVAIDLQSMGIIIRKKNITPGFYRIIF